MLLDSLQNVIVGYNIVDLKAVDLNGHIDMIALVGMDSDHNQLLFGIQVDDDIIFGFNGRVAADFNELAGRVFGVIIRAPPITGCLPCDLTQQVLFVGTDNVTNQCSAGNVFDLTQPDTLGLGFTGDQIAPYTYGVGARLGILVVGAAGSMTVYGVALSAVSGSGVGLNLVAPCPASSAIGAVGGSVQFLADITADVSAVNILIGSLALAAGLFLVGAVFGGVLTLCFADLTLGQADTTGLVNMLPSAGRGSGTTISACVMIMANIPTTNRAMGLRLIVTILAALRAIVGTVVAEMLTGGAAMLTYSPG